MQSPENRLAMEHRHTHQVQLSKADQAFPLRPPGFNLVKLLSSHHSHNVKKPVFPLWPLQWLMWGFTKGMNLVY